MPAGEARDPNTSGPLRAGHDHRHRDGDHDAGAGRGARDAAGPGHVEDAARRRSRAVSWERRRRPDHRSAPSSRLPATTWVRRCPGRAICSRSRSRAISRGSSGTCIPRFRTPVNAILVTSGVSLVLAVSARSPRPPRSARSAACWSTSRPARRRSVFAIPRSPAVVRPATFTIPFGPLIPSVAIVIALAIVAGATFAQLIGGATAVVVGAVLYAVTVTNRERR